MKKKKTEYGNSARNLMGYYITGLHCPYRRVVLFFALSIPTVSRPLWHLTFRKSIAIGMELSIWCLLELHESKIRAKKKKKGPLGMFFFPFESGSSSRFTYDNKKWVYTECCVCSVRRNRALCERSKARGSKKIEKKKASC